MENVGSYLLQLVSNALECLGEVGEPPPTHTSDIGGLETCPGRGRRWGQGRRRGAVQQAAVDVLLMRPPSSDLPTPSSPQAELAKGFLQRILQKV